MARPTGRPVKDEILQSARSLIQRVGVGGFSYADLASELGIKAPSIHHHFRTKEDLVAEVVSLYREAFAASVASLDGPTEMDRLQQYAGLFNDTAAADQACLCGAVAGEWLLVGDAVRAEVAAYFADQQRWIERQLGDAAEKGLLRPDLDVAESAQLILAALEGAMLLTRAGGKRDTTAAVAAVLLSLLAPES